MDFLETLKTIIVPYVGTLLIMDEGQVHVILMRRETEKERVLPFRQFTKNREVCYLSALKRDEGRKSVMPATLPEKLPQRRK